MKLRFYIGNLAWEITEPQLKDELEFLGVDVQNVRIVTDQETGHSKGFGFFESMDNEESVVAKADGVDIQKRRVRVSIAARQPRARSA